MFAVSGQPIEMLGAVMDRVDSPQEADAVLQAMAPVDTEIAQGHDFDGLEPPGLRRDRLAETVGDDAVEPVAEIRQNPKDQAAPEEVLAEKEAEIGEPSRAKEVLPRLCWKDHLQGSKNQNQEEETKASGQNERVKVHGCGPGNGFTGKVSTTGKERAARQPEHSV
jgi:hypothetical protein